MSAVQQYIDLYHSQKDLIAGHSSPVMNALRDEAMALLESKGLPTLKDEEYRRTDIESLYAPELRVEPGPGQYRNQSLRGVPLRCAQPEHVALLCRERYLLHPGTARCGQVARGGRGRQLVRDGPAIPATGSPLLREGRRHETRRHGGAQHRLCPGRILPLYPRRGGGREAHPAGEYTAGVTSTSCQTAGCSLS